MFNTGKKQKKFLNQNQPNCNSQKARMIAVVVLSKECSPERGTEEGFEGRKAPGDWWQEEG